MKLCMALLHLLKLQEAHATAAVAAQMQEGAEKSEGCANRAQRAPAHALPPNARFLGSDCAL